MRQIKDLSGKRFGRLLVIEQSEINKWGKVAWVCKCDCGVYRICVGTNLKVGTTKSCGCLGRTVAKTHGMSKTKFFNVWRFMKSRTDEKYKDRYKDYSGRGIKMCKRWVNFENFYTDMFASYKEGLILDRINNEGDYKPSNCRWVTSSESNSNKRSNRLLTINGETKTLAAWALISGIEYNTIRGRLSRNWLLEKIFSEPKIKHRKKQKAINNTKTVKP